MDFASTQSEILAFLEQAQEENLRHHQKTKGSIAAFRLEKGSGPYKQWEKQPLCAEEGDAASASCEGDEDPQQPSSLGRVVSRRCSHILMWANYSFIAMVVIGGIMLGIHGRLHGTNHMNQVFLLRHGHMTIAPGPAPLQGEDHAKHSLSHAQGLLPPTVGADWASALLGTRYPLDRSHEYATQRHEASVSASATAAAAYWRKQKSETEAAVIAQQMSAPAPAPGPSRYLAWPLVESHVHSAPDLQPAWRAAHPPAPSLPPASLPREKPGIPGWVHKFHSSKEGAPHIARSPGSDAFPSVEPASVNKWSPFHAVREHHLPSNPTKISYLTPEELAALGNSLQSADTSDLHEEDNLDYHRYSYP